jgi:hypothetical protein
MAESLIKIGATIAIVSFVVEAFGMTLDWQDRIVKKADVMFVAGSAIALTGLLMLIWQW